MSARSVAAPSLGRAEKTVWIGMAFLMPLFFLLNLHDTFDLPKLALAYIGTAVLSLFWIGRATAGQAGLRHGGVELPLFLFLAVTAFSSWNSIEPALSWLGGNRVYVFGFIPLLCLTLLGWLSLQRAVPLEILGGALFIAGAFAGGYGTLQYAGWEVFEAMPPVQGGRPWSSLGNPLYLGAVCMMTLPFAYAFWLRARTRMARAGIVFLTFCNFAGLVLSMSRSAWLGGMAGAVWMMWQLRGSTEARRTRFGFWALIAGCLLAAALFTGAGQRLRTTFSLKDKSNAARIEGWKAGLRMFQDHPWLGSGPDTFVRGFRRHRSPLYLDAAGPAVTQAHAHNDFIQMAATQGILGLIAFLGVLAAFLWRLRSVENPMSVAGVASLLALLAQNQFNFSSVTTTAWAAMLAGSLLATASVNPVRLPALRPRWRRTLCLLVVIFTAAGVGGVLRFLRADWQYKQGLARTQGGQPLAALEKFERALQLNPYREEYELAAANAARDVGLRAGGASRSEWIDRGWRHARAAVERHPFNPDSWNNLGVAGMWKVQLAGHDDAAAPKAAFEKAVALDPLFVDAWSNLAKWEHLMGNAQAEAALWRRVLALDKNNTMGRAALGLAGPS